jgi:hypothetical protein
VAEADSGEDAEEGPGGLGGRLAHAYLPSPFICAKSSLQKG